MDIKELAEKIQQGDEEAFKQLFDAYFGKIYGFLLTILGNSAEAEDVTSITFIYVWDNRGKLRKPELLVSWLYQIAKHRAFDRRRKIIREAAMALDGLEETVSDGAEALEVNVDRYYSSRFTSSLLSGLTDDERAILHLRYSEDLSFEEIAARVDASSVAVRVRVPRIIKKLQKEMANDMESEDKTFLSQTIL